MRLCSSCENWNRGPDWPASGGAEVGTWLELREFCIWPEFDLLWLNFSLILTKLDSRVSSGFLTLEDLSFLSSFRNLAGRSGTSGRDDREVAAGDEVATTSSDVCTRILDFLIAANWKSEQDMLDFLIACGTSEETRSIISEGFDWEFE